MQNEFMRVKTLIIFHVICPIILGGLIYISFRSMSLRLFNWFEIAGLKTNIISIRSVLHPFKNNFMPWVYFSLPDGLWVYSFSSALLIIWKNNYKEAKYWLIIPLISVTLIEIAQGLKILSGTFDILDLVFTLIALILSIKIINYKFKQNDKKEELH